MCGTQILKNSCLLYTINEWNKLDPEITIDSSAGFRKKLPSLIKPTKNMTFSIYDPLRIKLLNKLRVNVSHLNEHKCRHKFAETLNPICSCSLETKSMGRLFLCYTFFI